MILELFQETEQCLGLAGRIAEKLELLQAPRQVVSVVGGARRDVSRVMQVEPLKLGGVPGESGGNDELYDPGEGPKRLWARVA